MAHISISAWDIAQVFGLEYYGYGDTDEDYNWNYIFMFQGEQILIEHNWLVDDEKAAYEAAGHIVLNAIGAIAAERLK